MSIVAIEGINIDKQDEIAAKLKEIARVFGYAKATIYTYPYQHAKSLPEKYKITRKYPHGFSPVQDWPMFTMSRLSQMHYLSLRLKTHNRNELTILDSWYESVYAKAPSGIKPKARDQIIRNITQACEQYYGTKLYRPDLWVYCKTRKDTTRAERETAFRYERSFHLDPYVTRIDIDNNSVEECALKIFKRLKPHLFTPQTANIEGDADAA